VIQYVLNNGEKKMKKWVQSNIKNANTLGFIEEPELFLLLETDTRIVFGGACNSYLYYLIRSVSE
jgi:hypothetical protein